MCANCLTWDTKAISGPFEKKVVCGTYTKCRLDRALANADWLAKFPLASVTHQTGVTSDHSPLLLALGGGNAKHVQRPFKYEVMWETHDSFRDLISTGWGLALLILRSKSFA